MLPDTTDSLEKTRVSKHRLVTRSDFDGLVCAVLLEHLEMIDDILFVHPKDMQDGKVEITDRDITTNLPYVEGVHLAFDHHESETVRNEARDNHVILPHAPSAARVVWDYYGGPGTFTDRWLEMMEAVDKADSAQYSEGEILHPRGWELLNFIMDPRTGLGRFREFRISNYHLMMDLIAYCKNHTIEEILRLPDVVERTDLYFAHQDQAREQISRCSTIHDNLIVLDLTGEDTIWPANRFLIYAMYPECNISIHKLWGFQKQNTVFATGKSIIDRSCGTNIGDLMLRHGGGGHPAAGTCQIETDDADRVLNDLIDEIVTDHRAILGAHQPG
ncbi:MAG: nanoRNase/pAp phosphatase (c-di-AMP/oligoRNAs hydrolase) [Acidimicrobiales bacterium]|jgi:nanoRNase/pAp phosphatase (c-di-AMP/oligoRNAs hydrolase)